MRVLENEKIRLSATEEKKRISCPSSVLVLLSVRPESVILETTRSAAIVAGEVAGVLGSLNGSAATPAVLGNYPLVYVVVSNR